MTLPNRPAHYVAQASIATALGPMLAAATDLGLAGLWFDAQAHHPGPINAPTDPSHPWLRTAAEALAVHEQDTGSASEPAKYAQLLARLPLDLHGTPFQLAVWQALRTLPWGQTGHYGALAQAIGRPKAVRAVGAAVGRNPVSLLLPCHRVLGRDGSLTGYAGGLERKVALLRREGICL